MPDGSEFQTAGTATLKLREGKVVRTRGADSRLVFAERIDRVCTGSVVIKKGMEVSRLSGAASVVVCNDRGHSYPKLSDCSIYVNNCLFYASPCSI